MDKSMFYILLGVVMMAAYVASDRLDALIISLYCFTQSDLIDIREDLEPLNQDKGE